MSSVDGLNVGVGHFLQVPIKEEPVDPGDSDNDSRVDWKPNLDEFAPVKEEHVDKEESAWGDEDQDIKPDITQMCEQENVRKTKATFLPKLVISPTTPRTTDPAQLTERQLSLRKKQGIITEVEQEQLRTIWKTRKKQFTDRVRAPSARSQRASSSPNNAESEQPKTSQENLNTGRLSERQLKKKKKEGTITAEELEQLRSIWRKKPSSTPKTLPESASFESGEGEVVKIDASSGTLSINGLTEGVLRKKKRTTGLTAAEDFMLKALYREHARLKRLKEKISPVPKLSPAKRDDAKHAERLARRRVRERERYSAMTPEQLAARSARRKELRQAKSAEWKQEANQKRQLKKLMMSDEEKEVARFKAMVHRLHKKGEMTEKDKERRRQMSRQRWNSFTPEQKAAMVSRGKAWRQNMSEEKRAEYCRQLRKKYHSQRGLVLNNPSKWEQAEQKYQQMQRRYRELGIPKAVVVRGLPEEEKVARKRQRTNMLARILGWGRKDPSTALTTHCRPGSLKEKIVKLMEKGMTYSQARYHLQSPEKRDRTLLQARVARAKKILRNKLQQAGAPEEKVNLELEQLAETFTGREIKRRVLVASESPDSYTPTTAPRKNVLPMAEVEEPTIAPLPPQVMLPPPQIIHPQNIGVVPILTPDAPPEQSLPPDKCLSEAPKQVKMRRVSWKSNEKEGKPPAEPQPCELCGKMVSKKMVHLHKRYSHNPHWVNSSCSLCSLPFPNVQKFDRHYRATHGNLFPSQFPRSREYWAEKAKHRASVPQPWQGRRVNPTTICSYCGLEVARTNLEVHIRRRHNTSIDYHQCPNCPKRFKDERVMKAHHDKHHPQEQPLLGSPCSRCSSTFRKVEELKKHAQAAHPEQFFACPTCTTFRFSKQTIKFHMTRCSGGVANMSKMTFPPELVETTAINHLITKCEVCGKSMVLGSLRAHVKDMHGIVEDRLPCFRCDKTFKQHVFLVEHLDFCHGLPAEEVMEQVCRLNVEDKESEQFKERVANPPLPRHRRPEHYARKAERKREKEKLKEEGVQLTKRWVRKGAQSTAKEREDKDCVKKRQSRKHRGRLRNESEEKSESVVISVKELDDEQMKIYLNKFKVK